jgi:hypothetical protein
MPKPNLKKAPWSHLFAYSDTDDQRTPFDVRACITERDTETRPFTATDVEQVLASSKGTPGGEPWLLLGQLTDGRYFLIRALQQEDGSWPDQTEHEGCCWTPQGAAYVATTLDAIHSEVADTTDLERLAIR